MSDSISTESTFIRSRNTLCESTQSDAIEMDKWKVETIIHAHTYTHTTVHYLLYQITI